MVHNKFDRENAEIKWKYAFAARLKRILSDRNIKHAAFARSIGVSERVLNSYLNAVTIPNYFMVTVIAEALDMPIEVLTDLRPGADLFRDEDDWDEEEFED